MDGVPYDIMDQLPTTDVPYYLSWNRYAIDIESTDRALIVRQGCHMFRVYDDDKLGGVYLNRDADYPTGKWIRSTYCKSRGDSIGFHIVDDPSEYDLAIGKTRKWYNVEYVACAPGRGYYMRILYPYNRHVLTLAS